MRARLAAARSVAARRALLAAGLLALACCGDRDAGATAAASASSSADAAGALSPDAAASAAPALEPLSPVAASFEALLLATAGCEKFRLSNEALDAVKTMDDFLCPQERALLERAKDPELGEELSSDRHAPAAEACERHVAHESVGVRRAAMRCLLRHVDGVRDPKRALGALLDQAVVEPDGETARLLFDAVRELGPTRHGEAPRLVGILHKRAEEDAARAARLSDPHERARFYPNAYEDRSARDAGVRALVPRSKEHAPAREAVDYALSLARAGKGSAGLVELLGRSDLEPSVVCEAYAELAASKDLGWFSGLDGAASTRGHCREQGERFADALVARLVEERTSRALPPLAGGTLSTLVEAGVFDAAAKARILAAVAAIPKSERVGSRYDDLEKLLK